MVWIIRRINYMIKRGQGATEYLIILAVIIVIALIVVGVLGGIPGIGSNAKTQAGEAYWATSEIGVSSYSGSAATDVFKYTIKNNQEDTIIVDSALIGTVTNNTNATLSPGQQADFTVAYTCENQGDAFDLGATINYENVEQTSGHAFTGSVNLIGSCAD
jgi:hypothetical protein